MIGPEDIQETPKPNYTPILILGIAALLLLVVGFMSFRDYVNSKADAKVKESDDRIRKLEEQIAGMTQPASPAAQPAPPVRDEEMEELRAEMAAMKAQSELIKKQTQANTIKMDRVLENGPPPATQPNYAGIPQDFGAVPPPPGIRDDLTIPEYARQTLVSPPGGRTNRPAAEMTDMERRVANASSIGKIVSYDENWNLVTINAGKSNGITVGQRYTVRRGTQNLGIVKIMEAFTDQCNANIVTRNLEFDGALKPRVGDDIISFDPF